MLFRSVVPVVWLIFGLAWLKGLGVILEFMELRHAPALWRNALLALFTLMVALVLLAWAVASKTALKKRICSNLLSCVQAE